MINTNFQAIFLKTKLVYYYIKNNEFLLRRVTLVSVPLKYQQIWKERNESISLYLTGIHPYIGAG